MSLKLQCLVMLHIPVRHFSGHLVVVEVGLEVVEGGAEVWLLVPALDHHLIELVGTAGGLRHTVAPLHPLDHLAIVHACGGTSFTPANTL